MQRACQSTGDIPGLLMKFLLVALTKSNTGRRECYAVVSAAFDMKEYMLFPSHLERAYKPDAGDATRKISR